MSDELPPRHTLDSLKKEAKRWLHALQAHDGDAEQRYRQLIGPIPPDPTLRDVQLALAREQGFPGWAALKEALASRSAAGHRSLERYAAAARALLEAYTTGTPDAMERHYAFTWHRRLWDGMRSYVQLDLGRRPATAGDDDTISLDDARYLVAREHGFDDWLQLTRFTAAIPGGRTLTIKSMGVASTNPSGDEEVLLQSRDWDVVLHSLSEHPGATLGANGQMTDAMLAQLPPNLALDELRLDGSRGVTDEGVRHLARVPSLRRLDLNGTAVTDRGLAVLAQLPALESLSLAMTRVTDAGMSHLRSAARLQRVNLMWTSTGDGAIAALAGKEQLRQFKSGNGVTDAGITLLHQLPVFKRWRGGEAQMALLSYECEPNQLTLRGVFTDRGLAGLNGLAGLYGLNLDSSELAITAAGVAELTALPNLGWLALDAKDDWMPHIAAMPKLRFLGTQDTSAGDVGFTALAASKSLELLWGRRSHNLRRRGFEALARMPLLRSLSTSLLNVDDPGLATLPDFPALRELMPMDVPDAGYRHIGRCRQLESLILMYCRDTTDAATEQITPLDRLSTYFNSYTTITDRTPELLSAMPSLERVTFDACHNLTDQGIQRLARLPRLRELRVAGARLTGAVSDGFPPTVRVSCDR